MFYLLKWKSNLNIDDIIYTLKEQKLIPTTLICPNCNNDMVIHKDSSRKDNYRWVCKRCRKRKPIRINTWASKYKIPFRELYLLIRYYVEDLSPIVVANRLKLEICEVEDFYSDLDQLQHIFVDKMCNIIDKEITNSTIKDALKFNKLDFREFSRVFVLSRIFNIVLETLNEAL